MTILVTGGTGLVGSAIKELVGNEDVYYFASRSDGDLREYEQTIALFEKVKPIKVIHLAARVGGLLANLTDNIGFFEDNMAINQNVVKACHLFEVCEAIFCLSTCVFPRDTPIPITEEFLHAGPPHASNEGYAYSKRMLECHVRYYRACYGYNWICVIPTNIYGPHDNFELEHAHVVPAMIHRCMLAKSQGNEFSVLGSGTPLRQFIYSHDVAAIILTLLRLQVTIPDESSTIILAPEPGQEMSIQQLANEVALAAAFTGDIVFDNSKPNGIHRKTACNQKLRSLIPDFIFTSLKIGLEKTVEWFALNYKSARI